MYNFVNYFKKAALFYSFILLNYCANAQEKTIATYIAQAPFKMQTPILPIFKSANFLITDYGAVGDGKMLNTDAFAKAIQACAVAGGGKVIIPAGTWLTGPIELKSNVELHTERDAIIQFTANHSKYPMITIGSSSKQIIASPIYGFNLTNIAITGSGIFDGAGNSWRPVKKSKLNKSDWDALILKGGTLSSDGKVYWPDAAMMNNDIRPYMVYLVGCSNILLETITLKNSPKFVFYPNKCTNITLNGVHVYNEWYAQNGDGIDISACKNVVIYKCVLSVGDDGICMKSSGTPDSVDSANLSNILIADCIVFRAHGGFVIGSNTDGGMKNIYVTNCNFIGTDIGVRIKSNGGRGGWVRDVFVNNIAMKNIVNEAILFDTYYEDGGAAKSQSNNKDSRDKIPDFRNIYLSDISCQSATTGITIAGLPEKTIKNIYFKNIDITANKTFTCSNAEDIYFKNVLINGSSIKNNSGCKNVFVEQ